jgi:hypothetical protein
VAYEPISAGTNENIVLTINWREVSTVLHAVLYEDAGDVGNFEIPVVDKPVQLEGVPVAAAFEARYPPDVFVLNQPVVNGEIVVEKAVSYGPGWLVVYFDDEGGLGNIIGFAPLENGINEQIVVSVVESAVTSDLHLMLHEDTEALGEFEFPRVDPMVLYQGKVPSPTTFRTDSGNYLITRDQSISSDNEVNIPIIVVDVDAWIVIYNDLDGGTGDIIGKTWLPAGLHRDASVSIDSEMATATLYAALHLDAGEPKEFEYPEQADVRLRRNLSDIISPFTLYTEDAPE